MFKRLIVATDLSPASFAVVSCLSGLKIYGAEHCLLLQCLSFNDATSVALSYDTNLLKEMLQEQKRILEKQGFVVEARTVFGTPKREIIRAAAEEECSLIVVGAQGHSLVEEKLLGGVAYGVINKSVKPVMVVPVEKKPGDDNACEPVARCGFSDHILFATDFSEMADNAFAYVKQLVAHGARKVTLVHIQDKINLEQHLKAHLMKEFNEHDRNRLEDMKQSLLKLIPIDGIFFDTPSPENLKQANRQQSSTQVDTEVCLGIPYVEITRLIQERNAQLVVMGTQGRGFVKEFFLGSVSHSVARYSVAPVLLIPFTGKNA